LPIWLRCASWYFHLVCVDAEGGVGFAVSESALDVDEVVVECDQHARVTVAEVVQRRFRRRELRGRDGAVECGARDFAFEPASDGATVENHHRAHPKRGASV
jgi:hypothetical protein